MLEWHRDIIAALALASDVAGHYQNGVDMAVQTVRLAMAQHYQNADAKECKMI